jgi:flavin-dependent thymidylate synthase
VWFWRRKRFWTGNFPFWTRGLSARVSYGEGTKSYREDAGLIDYLLRNRHTSPFEQISLTFHVKMPIFIARQWVRHRTARLNEISGRYKDFPARSISVKLPVIVFPVYTVCSFIENDHFKSITDRFFF